MRLKTWERSPLNETARTLMDAENKLTLMYLITLINGNPWHFNWIAVIITI